MTIGQIYAMLQSVMILLSSALTQPTTREDKIYAIQQAKDKIEIAQQWINAGVISTSTTQTYRPKCHIDSLYGRVECNPLVHPSTTTVENNGEFGQIPPM